MDFQKLKNLVKQTGDKFVFMDQQGEPDVVVLSFQEYGRLLQGMGTGKIDIKTMRVNFPEKPEMKSEPMLEETEFVPPLAPEAKQNMPARSTLAIPARLEDIQLEDLPL